MGCRERLYSAHKHARVTRTRTQLFCSVGPLLQLSHFLSRHTHKHTQVSAATPLEEAAAFFFLAFLAFLAFFSFFSFFSFSFFSL